MRIAVPAALFVIMFILSPASLLSAESSEDPFPGYDTGSSYYSKYFIDPNYKEEDLSQTQLGEAEKRLRASEDELSKHTRNLFNIDLLGGVSGGYTSSNRYYGLYPYNGAYIFPTKKRNHYLEGAMVINLDSVFNVAKYFALGFGFELNNMFLFNNPKIEGPYKKVQNQIEYYLKYIDQSPSPADITNLINALRVITPLAINSQQPFYYLEIPIYVFIRFYFSKNFQAPYLSLGAGYDFFLLGHPYMTSIIVRPAFGVTFDNGFTMEFAYEYNIDLKQDSKLTEMRNMHRGLVLVGYCFNVGDAGPSSKPWGKHTEKK